MNINLINGVHTNSYTPKANVVKNAINLKNTQQHEPKIKNREPKIPEKVKEFYTDFKKKFPDFNFTLVNEEKMEEIKRNPSKFNDESPMSVFISDNELIKMAENDEFAKKMESNINKATDEIPAIKNELDKKGVSASNLGLIFEKDDVNLLTQLGKPKNEFDKLLDRTQKSNDQRRHEYNVEIRKKYAPKHRPTDETMIIKREDKITIISNSILDLAAAIDDFGMDYFMKPNESGMNLNVQI